MPAPNEDFGRAVREALDWMGCTPDMAAQSLGIKPQTVNAMLSGIVPMRSLVIKFGAEVGRRAGTGEGAPSWWRDVDAWLATAGYPPRRDGVFPAETPAAAAPETPVAADRVRESPPAPSLEPLAEDPCSQEPAARHFRPCYDRLPCGESFFHVFRILDAEGCEVYQLRFPAPVDYRRRAATLKRDLAALTKGQFERRYAQYRHHVER